MIKDSNRKTEMKTNNPKPLAASKQGEKSGFEAGLYFFTIYTSGQKTRLGRISRRGMKPNTFGRMAEAHWHNLSRVFPDIRLDTFALMPDRIHGIIEIAEGSPHRIAAILRTFKSFSTREINKNQQTPGNIIWQQKHDERVLHERDSLAETQAQITGAHARWWTDHQHRLNPISRQNRSPKGALSLSCLRPYLFAAGH
jgi:REP element-mobilizing transposase RayT